MIEDTIFDSTNTANMNTFIAIQQSGDFKECYIRDYKNDLKSVGLMAVISRRGRIERMLCIDRPHVDNCGRRITRTAVKRNLFQLG